MLLRASGQREDTPIDLTAVTAPDAEAGVPHGKWLERLTRQTITRDWPGLAATCEAAARAMGRQETVDALIVAAAFNGITRVADATGIPLDGTTRDSTGALRAEVGLDAFDYPQKLARYGPDAGRDLTPGSR